MECKDMKKYITSKLYEKEFFVNGKLEIVSIYGVRIKD